MILRPAAVTALLSSLLVMSTAVGASAAPKPSEQTTPTSESTDRYIVRYASDADVEAETKALRSQGVGVGRTFSKAVRGAAVVATKGQIEAVKRSGRATAVEIDAPVTMTETQPQPGWGLDRIDQRALPLSSTYSYAASGAGVSAYVIDTGVYAAHNDFGGRVAAGWTAVNDGLGTGDCNGHGTHVAGTIAGATYGVAKAATIVPVRVLDCSGSGYNSDVIAGLDWIEAHHTAGTPAVVNMSLGGPASSMVDSAVQSVINDGVTVVVAAGNSADDACSSSPARVAGALTVAASDSSDRQASFSNFGSCVDLYAPGVAITSASYTSPTASATMSGTSMATPHVAGAVAVLLSQSPSLTPATVESRITSGATPGVIAAASAGTPNRLLYSDPSTVPAPAPSPAPAPTPAPVAPKVTVVSPAPNSTSVATSSNVAATFSTNVQGLSAGTFVLKSPSGASVPAAVSYNATTRTATLNPSASLSADARYTATLVGGTTAIRDANGTPLATTSWTFTTGPAPVITAKSPGSGASLVKRGTAVTVTFNEAVQGVGTGTFTLKNYVTGAVVSATVTRNGTTNQWILKPTMLLDAKTKYTVTVTGGPSAIGDLAGNSLVTTNWTFTTGSV